MLQTNLQGISTIRTNDTVSFKTKVKQKQEKIYFQNAKGKTDCQNQSLLCFN